MTSSRQRGLPELFCGLLAAGAVAWAGRAAASELSPSTEVISRLGGDSRAVRDAVDRGLEFLANRQESSGALGSRYRVAVTSLAGLAVLGAGHLPGQGKYGRILEKCWLYLRGSDDGTGFLTEPGGNESRMHGHCYAVLFLCELLGSLPPEREAEVSGVIRRGVKVIERAQTRDGGWYYTTRPGPEEDEASVTVCALQALRAARNVGISVSSSTVEDAILYVRKCQVQADGSFDYSRHMPGKPTYALTVAALSTLNAAGVYDWDPLRRGFDYVRKRLERVKSPWKAADEEFVFYANFYAAQSIYQRGGDLWARWYPGVRDHLVAVQDRHRGSWSDRFGEEYATAVAILILEIPLGYLPIFQR